MAEASAHSLALFLDFENFALGLTDPHERFDINRVLRRMVEKGKVVVRKAYADWSYYPSYTAALHEAGFELIDIPRRSQSGKNSADIRLCVDAMDLAYSKEHIDTFVILSGDSDFTPLVSKLKELGKHVIGVGMANATSDLLRDNCDEFIYYEDLEHIVSSFQVDPRLPENKRKAFQLLMDALTALRRENKEVMWSSLIKETMKRLKPSFNETYHGYHSFTELLEDAERHGLLELAKERRSGAYVVTRFGEEMREELPPAEARERARRRVALGRRRLERTGALHYGSEWTSREHVQPSVAAEAVAAPTAEVTAPSEGAAPSVAAATETTSTAASPTTISGPPRIVFTIGEVGGRTEPAYVPPSPPEIACVPVEPSRPATADSEAQVAPPSESAAPVVEPSAPTETPPPAATEPTVPPSSPTRPTTPTSTTPTPRRETRPFGYGVFDNPPDSES